jgi:hypothetical protein
METGATTPPTTNPREAVVLDPKEANSCEQRETGKTMMEEHHEHRDNITNRENKARTDRRCSGGEKTQKHGGGRRQQPQQG